MNTNNELSRRDFLRGAAVAAAGVTLAACAPAAAPTQVAPKAPTVAPPTAAPPAEAITIQYWVQWGGTTVDGLKKCGEKFTAKSPGITTNIVGDADNSKILAAVAGGTTPEMGSNLDYLALIARGVCTPQTEWISYFQHVMGIFRPSVLSQYVGVTSLPSSALSHGYPAPR